MWCTKHLMGGAEVVGNTLGNQWLAPTELGPEVSYFWHFSETCDTECASTKPCLTWPSEWLLLVSHPLSRVRARVDFHRCAHHLVVGFATAPQNYRPWTITTSSPVAVVHRRCIQVGGLPKRWPPKTCYRSAWHRRPTASDIHTSSKSGQESFVSFVGECRASTTRYTAWHRRCVQGI